MASTVFQVRMDENLKKQVEKLYEELGTSFTEAVRIFAAKSLSEHGFPFEVTSSYQPPLKKVLHAAGIAHEFADVAKWPMEKEAWAMAVKEKYENR